MAEARPILDPPHWFWRLIDDARGDAARLRDDLATFDREGLMLFYGYLRDLATRLTGDAHTASVAGTFSDETAFERGAWVVTQGRERYRQAVRDPAALPPEARPGSDSERRMLGVPAEVWFEQFGDTMPTDVEIDWQPDGSAAPQ